MTSSLIHHHQFRCQAQVGAVPVRHIPCRPQGALAEPSGGPTFPRIWAKLQDKQETSTSYNMTPPLDVVTSSWHSPVMIFVTFLRFSYFFSRKTQKTSNFRAHLYVFEGEESNGDKHTELASSIDLKNPDQLPVKEAFEDIVMIVSQKLS